jgi:hypothetical protein
MGLFKNKVYKLNEKEYGYLLSKMILTSAKNGLSEIKENFNSSRDMHIYFLELLLHYAYICECLLKEKYHSLKAERCVSYAIEGIVINLGIFDDAINEHTEQFLEMYAYLKNDKCNIFTEEGLHKLVNSYQNRCELGYDHFQHLSVFLLFSGFIIHHTSDVAGDHLSLI